jgi:hypothetical protein
MEGRSGFSETYVQPDRRATAAQALRHQYFNEPPVCVINVAEQVPKEEWRDLVTIGEKAQVNQTGAIGSDNLFVARKRRFSSWSWESRSRLGLFLGVGGGMVGQGRCPVGKTESWIYDRKSPS